MTYAWWVQVLLIALIPQTIEVRVTGLRRCEPVMSYTTETVDLKDYVKGVLPNEWGKDWPEASLQAGAVAVKNYAVSVYRSQGFVWDCDWNQVYDPSWRSERTDQAVEDTWDLWLIDRNYQLVRTYYNADEWGCATQGPQCMSQWGSKDLAENGNSLRFIILTNYDGALVRVYNEVKWAGHDLRNQTSTRRK